MGRGVRETAEQMRRLHREIAQLQAQLTQCIAEFDTVQGYELDNYRSTAAWLRAELHLHPRDASQLVGIARQLRHLPAVAAAFTNGEISHPHVALITRTAQQVGVEHVAAAQDTLLDLARTSTPDRLRVATRHLRYCIDPDGVDRDAVKAYERRELSVAPTLYGMVAIQGMLDPPSGATVLAALDTLTPPPSDDDQRTAGQRRADALTELCRRQLDSGTLPQVNGDKPHVLVTVSYESLIRQPGAEPGRARWVGPLSATDARLLACDSAIIPAVLSSTGEVLDIGRKTRVWPTGIRRAIELRDSTCRHVDCDVPAEHCDVHHKVHWADGGSTSYQNGILICRHHHTMIHRYHAAFRPDGQFTIMRN